MNKELLKKVRDRITARPKQFNMRKWFSTETSKRNKVSHCGTACCIAGWALSIKMEKKPDLAKHILRAADALDLSDKGQRALGLTLTQSRRLFYLAHWPGRYFNAYHKANSDTAVARVAARRINHFMKTGK